ncbi:hypothetical protein GCM10010402_12660 [Actinomadura luteofluorescens]
MRVHCGESGDFGDDGASDVGFGPAGGAVAELHEARPGLDDATGVGEVANELGVVRGIRGAGYLADDYANAA